MSLGHPRSFSGGARRCGRSRSRGIGLDTCEPGLHARASNSETIEIAIALDIHGQVRIIVRPFLVFLEFDVAYFSRFRGTSWNFVRQSLVAKFKYPCSDL